MLGMIEEARLGGLRDGWEEKAPARVSRRRQGLVGIQAIVGRT